MKGKNGTGNHISITVSKVKNGMNQQACSKVATILSLSDVTQSVLDGSLAIMLEKIF